MAQIEFLLKNTTRNSISLEIEKIFNGNESEPWSKNIKKSKGLKKKNELFVT